MTRSSVMRTTAAFAFAMLAAACGKKQEAPKQPPPPEVGVLAAKAESVPLTQDLVGRV